MGGRAHGKLSEKTIAALPAPAKGNKVYPFGGDTLQGITAPMGYGIKVTKAGHRSHVLDYRINGNERQFNIGSSPDWPAIRAIRQARDLRQQIDRGGDPQAAKELARSPTPAGKTVGDVLDAFVERYVKKTGLRSAAAIESAFRRLVKPAIGRKGIYELRRSHLVDMFDKIEDTSGPVMADRTRSYLGKALRWYAARDDDFNLDIAPVEARTKPKERARQRTLDDQEIRDMWAGLDQIKNPSCYPRYVRGLLLTATRRTELARMSEPEIDGDVWIIPPSRSKNKLEHAVPLSDAARKVIGNKPKQSLGPYVFSTDDGRSPFSGFGKAKESLDAKITELRAKDGRPPMPHWTLHDLRRTARSLMSRAGVSADIGERVLNHVLTGVRHTYDRWSYVDEKRDALNRLAAMVERILNPPADNVASLEERRRAAADA